MRGHHDVHTHHEVEDRSRQAYSQLVNSCETDDILEMIVLEVGEKKESESEEERKLNKLNKANKQD